MKTAITLVLILSALLFAPTLFLEQFEQVRTWMLMSFAFLSVGLVNWKLLRKDPIAFLLGIFTCSAFVSTVFSIDPHMSLYGNWHAPLGLLAIFSYLVFYLAVRETYFYLDKFKGKYLPIPVDQRRAMLFIICSAAVVAAYACLQAFGIDFMQWNGTLSIGSYTRPPSTIGHPNFTAGYLTMVLPLVLHRIQRSHLLEQVLLGIAGTLMLCAILFCQSRGMWIAAGCSLLFYFIASGLHRYRIIYAAVALGLIFSSLLMVGPKDFKDSVLNRIQYIFEPGAARHEYPIGALRIWKKYPILGAGTDAFETAFQHQRTENYWAIERGGSPHRSHNDLLNILATQGILGFLIAIILTLAAALRLTDSKNPAKIAIAASLLAFFIEGMSSFVVIPTGVLAIFCLAIL